jgi:rubrerythrin
MVEMIGGLVPLDDMLAGLKADVLLEHDPGGETCIRLLDAVERHASLEEEALGQYDRIAVASGDPVVALVMQLILDDEERHHRLLERIATTLRDALSWTHSASALPHTEKATPTEQNLASVARALIEEEHAGASALRRLAGREKGVDGGLDSLLLEMMAMDSDKHAHLLRFVQTRLEATARAEKSVS